MLLRKWRLLTSEQQTFRRACPAKWRKTADMKKLRHCHPTYRNVRLVTVHFHCRLQSFMATKMVFEITDLPYHFWKWQGSCWATGAGGADCGKDGVGIMQFCWLATRGIAKNVVGVQNIPRYHSFLPRHNRETMTIRGIHYVTSVLSALWKSQVTLVIAGIRIPGQLHPLAKGKKGIHHTKI